MVMMTFDRMMERNQAANWLAWQGAMRLGGLIGISVLGSVRKALDTYPNLMLDISWDVIYNAYYQYGQDFIDLFNAYPTRILNGSDFVAAGDKPFEQYWKELEITSRVNRRLNDEAFRQIALGENYFRLLNLDYVAPPVCRAGR